MRYGGRDAQSRANREAYVKGAKAAREGRPLSDNPYDNLQPQQHTAWNHGHKFGNG